MPVYISHYPNLKKIRKELNARAIRPFANSLPWPYNGMVNDLTGCIQTGGNYLAALGLVCYIEACGRRIFYHNKMDFSLNAPSFEKFLDRYMDLGFLLNYRFPFEGKNITFRNAVRNGLVHRYFLKADSSAVHMIIDNFRANRCGFFIDRPGHLAMAVIPLFKFFCSGLRKAKKEGVLK